MAELYLGPSAHDDPRASPLFADFKNAPPVFLTVGDTEILLDDTVRLHEKLQEQGVDVICEVTHDLPHVWPLFHNILPEARETLTDVAEWIKQQVPQ